MAPKTILVIDDEKDLAALLAKRLQAKGYRVICAYSGREGIEKAQKENPNLILLDVMMPEMDGFTTMHRLKNDPSTQGIPLIMLTAKSDSESIFQAERMGSVDYITKPYDAEEMMRMINRYIK